MRAVGFSLGVLVLLTLTVGCQPAARVAVRGTFGANGLDGEGAATGLLGNAGLHMGGTVALNTSLALSAVVGPEIHRAIGDYGIRGGIAAGAHFLGEGTGAEVRTTFGVSRIVGDGYAAGLELLAVARPIHNQDVDWFAGIGATFELGGCYRPAQRHPLHVRTCR